MTKKSIRPSYEHGLRMFGLPAKFSVVLLASYSLVACNENNMTAAHNAVRSLLKDPNSAIFDHEVSFPDAICGNYNAKNSYGGYGDPHLYVYVFKTKTAYLVPQKGDVVRDEEELKAWEVAYSMLKAHCHK